MFNPFIFNKILDLNENLGFRKVVYIPAQLTGISFKIIYDEIFQFSPTFFF